MKKYFAAFALLVFYSGAAICAVAEKNIANHLLQPVRGNPALRTAVLAQLTSLISQVDAPKKVDIKLDAVLNQSAKQFSEFKPQMLEAPAEAAVLSGKDVKLVVKRLTLAIIAHQNELGRENILGALGEEGAHNVGRFAPVLDKIDHIRTRVGLTEENASAFANRLAALFDAANAKKSAMEVPAGSEADAPKPLVLPLKAQLQFEDLGLADRLRPRMEDDYTGTINILKIESDEFDPSRAEQYERVARHLGVHTLIVNNPTETQFNGSKGRDYFLTPGWVIWARKAVTQGAFLGELRRDKRAHWERALASGHIKMEIEPLTVKLYEEIYRNWVREIAGREDGMSILWAADFAKDLEAGIINGKGHVAPQHGQIGEWIAAVARDPYTGRLVGGVIAQRRVDRGILHIRMGSYDSRFNSRRPWGDGGYVNEFLGEKLAMAFMGEAVKEGLLFSKGRDFSVLGQGGTSPGLLASKSGDGEVPIPDQDAMQLVKIIQPSRLAFQPVRIQDASGGQQSSVAEVTYGPLTRADYESFWDFRNELFRPFGGVWYRNFAENLAKGDVAAELKGPENWVAVYAHHRGTGDLMGGAIARFSPDRKILELKLTGINPAYSGQGKGVEDSKFWNHSWVRWILAAVRKLLSLFGVDWYFDGYPKDYRVNELLLARLIEEAQTKGYGFSHDPNAVTLQRGIAVMTLDPGKPFARDYFDRRGRGELPTGVGMLGSRVDPDKIADIWGPVVYFQPQGSSFKPSVPRGMSIEVRPLPKPDPSEKRDERPPVPVELSN